jgi:hypothetical protein
MNDQPMTRQSSPSTCPASLAADLEDLRRHFGDELVTDLVLKAHANFKGKLALRGVLLGKNQK